jgi:hypothetical protein
MSRRVRSSLLLAVATACAFVSSAAAGQQATRVLDRTFSCEMGYLGGIYQLKLETDWSAPQGSQTLEPNLTVSTNVEHGALGGIGRASMYANRESCQAARQKAPLATTGLHKAPFGRLPAEHSCDTPRRVLLRIRGEFVKPIVPRVESPFGYPQLLASGAMKRAQLALATLAGKPIAYASISGPRTQLYTSQACRED